MIRHTVRMAAPNDSNGNPRRVWVTTHTDPASGYSWTTAHDIGYAGSAACPWDTSRSLWIDVPVSQYKQALKFWGSDEHIAEVMEEMGEEA